MAGAEQVADSINQNDAGDIKKDAKVEAEAYQEKLGLSREDAEKYRGLMEARLKADDGDVVAVEFDPEVLKSGYICDVVLYRIIYKAPKPLLKVVLKVSNLDNALSSTAKNLDMYAKEAYFYDKLRKYVTSVAAPATLGVISDPAVEHVHGIMMEDLRVYDGDFNLSLSEDTDLLYHYVSEIYKLHAEFTFLAEGDVAPQEMKSLVKPQGITYYKDLVKNRFDKYWLQSEEAFTEPEKVIVKGIAAKYDGILDHLSAFPLSFCHGDVKSPNTFYRKVPGQALPTPYFLDWQYIHLNKGVSDVAFLLIESLAFDQDLVPKVERFYYDLHKDGAKLNHANYSYDQYLKDFRCSICSFAFFVMVWFNSENKEDLVDPTFPRRFLKNLIKYYNYYITEDFLASIA